MSSRSTFSRLKELLAPLAERPWTTICMVLLLLFYEAIWLAVTEILRQIISLVEQGQSLDLVYERAWWAVACLGIFLFLSFATYKIFWYRFIISIERFLAKKYITKYIFMDSEEVVKYGVGKMIPLITSGFHDWSEFMYKLVLDMTRTLFAFFIFMLYIAWINPDLLWIAGCYTLFSVCWIWIVNKRAVFFRKRRHETHDEATSYIVKMLMEKFTILKNNKVEQEQMRLRKLYDVSELWGEKTDFWLMLIHRTPRVFINAFKLIVVLVMGVAMYAGQGSFADIAVVMMVMGMLQGRVEQFNDSFKVIAIRAERPNRIIDLFDRIPQIQGYEEGPDYVYKSGEIEVRDVTFAYKKSVPVFENFSLRISGGSKVALVGKSGVGKSTLIKLILGFSDPQKGRVLVDGQSIHDFNLKSYYHHIGYLSQEPAVFDGSIRENLVYGLDDEGDLDEKKLWEAVDHAQCGFIHNFREGLATQIGEKGIRLSGGERQRLAIARLFLQDPDIIILDEPTSALDSFSEVKISQALHTLCDGKTLMVIAHRLQTVKDADTIFVLGANTVLEQGTHDELLSAEGEYASMVDLQSGMIRE